MAAKKATSATKKGLPAKRAVPVKDGATKSVPRSPATGVAASRSGAAKAAPKVGATKAAPKAPAKVGADKAASKAPAKARATTSRASKAAPRASAPKATAGARPQRLRVREDEKPWTAKERAAVRADLEADLARLQREISVAEVDLADLMRDVGDGAGDDPADAGTATFEREQEISLANNAREVFEQSARALARLVDGTYGVCESCGNPIGKNRLLAFPRATLCLTCKSKQERR